MDKDLAMYDYGWESAIEQCAAGPWIDGPPPKDGEEYLVITPSNETRVAFWGDTERAWYQITDSSYFWTDTDPIKHAVINLPKELDESPS